MILLYKCLVKEIEGLSSEDTLQFLLIYRRFMWIGHLEALAMFLGDDSCDGSGRSALSFWLCLNKVSKIVVQCKILLELSVTDLNIHVKENMCAITFIKIISMPTKVEVSTRWHSNKNTWVAGSIHSHTPMFTKLESEGDKIFIADWSFQKQIWKTLENIHIHYIQLWLSSKFETL